LEDQAKHSTFLSLLEKPTWEKEVSVFPWEFITTETALILEGECEMTP